MDRFFQCEVWWEPVICLDEPETFRERLFKEPYSDGFNIGAGVVVFQVSIRFTDAGFIIVVGSSRHGGHYWRFLRCSKLVGFGSVCEITITMLLIGSGDLCQCVAQCCLKIDNAGVRVPRLRCCTTRLEVFHEYFKSCDRTYAALVASC